MESPEPTIAKQIKKDEHTADTLKVENLHTLNEAFYPIDREDIYRAIMALDEVVNYCKTTVSEMDILGVQPDIYTHEMAVCLAEGVRLTAGPQTRQSAARGRHRCGHRPQGRATREKIYRKALAALFQGDDYLNMLKRREIYRHLSTPPTAWPTAQANLHDIVVVEST
jgi:hypothetical protein